MTTTQQPEPSGIATIALSPRIFVQGVFVRYLDEARIVVRVGDTEYAGQPISQVG